MKLMMFFISLFSALICYGQKTKLPEDLPMPLAAQSIPKMEAIFTELNSYSLNELTEASHWGYHLRNSILRHYLELDSALYHFNKSLELKPGATCKTLVIGIEYFDMLKETGYKSPDFTWFLYDFKEIQVDSFLSYCSEFTDNSNKPDSLVKTELSMWLNARDQRYRMAKLGSSDWDR